MRISSAAAGLSCLAVICGGSLASTAASADAVTTTYVVCNRFDECWRVHHHYTYPSSVGIVYHDAGWWDTNRADTQYHFLADPDNDRGYYDEAGTWRRDPGARAVVGAGGGAAAGAAIGCVVTIMIGCAPGAAAGAAIGAGAGAATGAATTPP
jgi:hypothetical protein